LGHTRTRCLRRCSSSCLADLNGFSSLNPSSSLMAFSTQTHSALSALLLPDTHIHMHTHTHTHIHTRHRIHTHQTRHRIHTHHTHAIAYTHITHTPSHTHTTHRDT